MGFGVGATEDQCEDTYKVRVLPIKVFNGILYHESISFQGTEWNSEPEVRAASSKVLELKDNIRVSMSVHSYGTCSSKTHLITPAQ